MGDGKLMLAAHVTNLLVIYKLGLLVYKALDISCIWLHVSVVRALCCLSSVNTSSLCDKQRFRFKSQTQTHFVTFAANKITISL